MLSDKASKIDRVVGGRYLPPVSVCHVHVCLLPGCLRGPVIAGARMESAPEDHVQVEQRITRYIRECQEILLDRYNTDAQNVSNGPAGAGERKEQSMETDLFGEVEAAPVQAQDEPEDEIAEGVSLPAADLYRVLFNASIFTAKDEARPILRCVRLRLAQHEGEWQLSAGATDSYRLAVDHAGVTGAPPVEHQWLLRLDTEKGKYLLKRLKGIKFQAEIQVEPEPDSITFHVPEFSGAGGLQLEVITLGSSEGEFPKIESLFPEPGGSVEQINLNPAYLADYAKVIGLDGSGIRLEYAKGTSEAPSFHRPVLITTGPTFRGVLMPIRRPV